MMEEINYLKLTPVLVFVLFGFFSVTIFYSRKQFVIYRKILIRYFFMSLGFIISFMFLYLAIFTYDLQGINEYHAEELNKQGITTEQKIDILNKSTHFKGLDFTYYKKNPWLLFVDLFYFSSMTFFTVGYGDITVIGASRLFVVIESIFGVANTGIYIAMALSNLNEIDKKEESLNMLINRGNDILCVRKTEIGNYSIFREKANKNYDIYLVDNQKKMNVIYNIDFNYEKEDFYRYYIMNWDFDSYKNQNSDYYWKFAKYLAIKLKYVIDAEYSIDLNKFLKTDSEMNIEEFKYFLNNLYKNQICKILDKKEDNDRIDEYIFKAIDKI